MTVTNTGTRAGKEVVQCYLSGLDAASPRPVRELRGFRKVALAPGASARVSFELTERDLSHWSARTDGWVLHPGRFEIAIGASSRDLRARSTVEVDGVAPSPPLSRASTLADWLASPVGHDLLVQGLRDAPGGDLSLLLDDEDTVMMLGSFPVNRLVTMMGGALDPRFVEDLLANLATTGGGTGS